MSGQTNEDPDDRLQARVVRLAFDVDSIWVEDYLALAYVCLHECLAHGYCGVDIEDPDAAASASFHEGWMDCVAAHVLAEALDDAPGAMAPHATSFARQTEAVRALRYNRSRAARSRDVDKWICGEQAFHAFERLFLEALKRTGRHGTLGLGALARAHAVRFSLALNASDVSHRDRARFYRAVLAHFGSRIPQRAREQIDRQSRVIDFVEHFISGETFRTLVQRIIDIPHDS